MFIIYDWITVPECPVVVIRHPLHQVKDRTWQAAYRTVPVVSYPHVQVSSVKVLKILIKWYKILKAKRNFCNNLTVSQYHGVSQSVGAITAGKEN